MASPEVTAIHRRSGLTATDAPNTASPTVSPTIICSTTPPVRGSRKVAATPSVPGPPVREGADAGRADAALSRRRPADPARPPRAGWRASGPGARAQRPEATVGPDVPDHDPAVLGEGEHPVPDVSISAQVHVTDAGVRGSPGDQRPVAGSTSQARPGPRRRRWPPRSRPVPARPSSRAPAGHLPAALRAPSGRRRVIAPSSHRRAAPACSGRQSTISASRAGGSTVAWLPVARSTSVRRHRAAPREDGARSPRRRTPPCPGRRARRECARDPGVPPRPVRGVDLDQPPGRSRAPVDGLGKNDVQAATVRGEGDPERFSAERVAAQDRLLAAVGVDQRGATGHPSRRRRGRAAASVGDASSAAPRRPVLARSPGSRGAGCSRRRLPSAGSFPTPAAKSVSPAVGELRARRRSPGNVAARTARRCSARVASSPSCVSGVSASRKPWAASR